MRKTYPRFVRIKNPLPGQEGTCILLGIKAGGDYRIALRSWHIQSFEFDEFRDVHRSEQFRRGMKWIRGQVCRPRILLTAFMVWMVSMLIYFGWRAAALGFMCSVAAVLWDRTRSHP